MSNTSGAISASLNQWSAAAHASLKSSYRGLLDPTLFGMKTDARRGVGMHSVYPRGMISFVSSADRSIAASLSCCSGSGRSGTRVLRGSVPIGSRALICKVCETWLHEQSKHCLLTCSALNAHLKCCSSRQGRVVQLVPCL